MLKALRENLKAFLISTTITGGGIYGYFYYVTYSNRVRFDRLISDDAMKDTTRDNYEFFGINWGFASDNMIKEKIDTGDFFYIKYDCNECLNLTDMVECFRTQLLNNEQEYDSMGLAFRSSEEDVFIMTSLFGYPRVMRYADFLMQPYAKELSMRKLKIKGNRKKDALEIQRSFKSLFENFETTFDPRKKLYENEKAPPPAYAPFFDRNPENLLWECLHRTNILIKDFYKKKLDVRLQEYDRNLPVVIENKYALDNKIVIRSLTNKETNLS